MHPSKRALQYSSEKYSLVNSCVENVGGNDGGELKVGIEVWKVVLNVSEAKNKTKFVLWNYGILLTGEVFLNLVLRILRALKFKSNLSLSVTFKALFVELSAGELACFW